jgi:hypothetical protein
VERNTDFDRLTTTCWVKNWADFNVSVAQQKVTKKCKMHLNRVRTWSVTDVTLSQFGAAMNDDRRRQGCLSCRVIGTGTLGAVGVYALRQSRRQAPGSPLGKRIMASVGVCTFHLLRDGEDVENPCIRSQVFSSEAC